jgi:hypothetical protein
MRAWIFLLLGGVAHADLAGMPPGNGEGTFCEFQVVDVETKKPRGGFRYTLTLPSGRKVRGRVPKNGLVHVDVPHAGDCTIDLDLPPGMIIPDQS